MERISSSPIGLFYCYDPNTQDMELLRQLKIHLEDLRRSGSISEREALAGDDEDVIKMRLECAHAILLLVSPDFLGSPSCNNQMEWAIERLNRKEAVRVIPVLLRPANIRNTAFSHRRKLPSNGRAVTLWDDRDDALQNVADGIGKVVEELQNQRRRAPEKQKEEGYVLTQTSLQRENDFVRASEPEPEPSGSPILLSSRATLNDPVSLPPTRIPKNKNKGWIAKHKNKRWIVLTASILLLVLLGAIFVPKLLPSTSTKIVGLSTSITRVGEQVGVSDGRFAFDTNRVDGPDKMQAANAFASRNTANAGKLWQKAIQEDPGDAEALIYQEDQRVLASHQPYVTLVVATILTGQNAHVGRDDLQGAYVAQKEFNGSHYPFQVRLLIANSGSGDESVAGQVAQQIVQLATQDKTVVGVMGWPFSESTVNAVKVLGPVHIPMVSETASTDDLNGRPYFFRLVPPNFQQGQANAQYVIQTLHAKRVALFVDYNNTYSSSFADDFKQSYLSQGNGTIVAEEQYTVGSQGQARLSTLLQDALRKNPDVIYFSGYASDLAILLDALPSFGPGASVPIVGGEGLYELGGYNQSSRAHLGQLHFLAYAYPDEWEIAGLAGQKPLFFQEYSDAFNPSGKTPPGVYGLTRAGNDVILAYDATRTLLAASTAVGQHVTGEQLQQALKQINDAHPLQGVSGRIAFGPDGNPLNKPLLLLSVDAQARFHEEALLSGCLRADHCG